VLHRLTEFLGYQLTPAEIELVSEKCSFQYMKDNEELFEMAPPNMFSVTGGQFLVSGATNRHQDVTPAVRERIVNYCKQTLRGTDYPAHHFYPDLVVSTHAEDEAAQQTMLQLSIT